MPADVLDTTGAGDALAAGYLVGGPDRPAAARRRRKVGRCCEGFVQDFRRGRPGLADPGAVGAVTAEVVIATFFNFHPDLVRRHIPAAWAAAPPERIVEARFVSRAPRSSVSSVTRSRAPRCRRRRRSPARPRSSAGPRGARSTRAMRRWAGPPILTSCFGTRSHSCASTAATATSPCSRPKGSVRARRSCCTQPPARCRPAPCDPAAAWSDDEWRTASEGLHAAAGWMPTGALTDAGRAHRSAVELRTDELARAPWHPSGRRRMPSVAHAGAPHEPSRRRGRHLLAIHHGIGED